MRIRRLGLAHAVTAALVQFLAGLAVSSSLPLAGAADAAAPMALSAVVGHAGIQAVRAADKPWAKAPDGVAAKDPLPFPEDGFTVETRTVKTSNGEENVTYRSYKHIPYVADPVDKDHESVDVGVPVEDDGVAVYATKEHPLVRGRLCAHDCDVLR